MRTPLAAIGLRGFPGVQGGVERHCAEILPHLDIPCRVYRRKPFVNTKSPAPHNITFVDLPSTRIKGFEAAWHTVLCVAHLLFHPVKIVNIHNIGPALLSPLLKLRGMRVVLTYHSTNYHHQKWGKFAKMLLKVGEKVGFRFSDKIIFVNESMISGVKNEDILAKSVVIPNPISKNTPTTSTDFCDNIGITPQKYILAVGRLTQEKGFETLIRTAASIPHEYKIVIAGAADNDSSYLSYLKSLDTENRVIFTGYADRTILNELY
ncbi:MAG: glycosyltransferase family 4 protein, partial [Paramuribaculum sp.]|nr:glycosyltransferase family 4 protein [Paramuribaculum sp.]